MLQLVKFKGSFYSGELPPAPNHIFVINEKGENRGALTQLKRFMQADPFWACAGAVNVMLVFFFRFKEEQLRRLNVYHWIICYGFPGVPAIFGLIYRKNGEHMYGNATVSPRLTHQN